MQNDETGAYKVYADNTADVKLNASIEQEDNVEIRSEMAKLAAKHKFEQALISSGAKSAPAARVAVKAVEADEPEDLSQVFIPEEVSETSASSEDDSDLEKF